MFTATLTNKTELPDGRLEVTVSYSDGVTTKVETFIPQDKRGYNYHVAEVLQSLETAKQLKDEDNVGKEIVTEPVDTRTQAEKDKDLWFAQYAELDTLNEILAKDFLTGPRLKALNDKITAAKSYLDTNAKVEYLDFI